jgi:exopolyphosphatase/guanosine-5'-triphosphate,3'-diphosphate pyrophosphatase
MAELSTIVKGPPPPLRGPRRAVIDIGTNSVKMLVVEEVAGHWQPLVEQSQQTRLGAGFYETHLLQKEPIAQTATAVAGFVGDARGLLAHPIRVIATSAARDARNQGELISAVERAAGQRMEIISGEQEAEWAFLGVTSVPALHGLRLLIMDLGGGSTEFILGENGRKQFCRSFPLGCVRLLERLVPPENPKWEDLLHCQQTVRNYLNEVVHPLLEPWLAAQAARPLLVGTGGTATILARMSNQMTGFDRDRIEATRLNHADVQKWMQDLWSMPLVDRKHVLGLPPNRADVILMGTAVYEAVMDVFKISELRISTRGLRFAAALAN